MNEPKKAFIWDLDGTLLNSYEAILTSLHETFHHFHIHIDEKAIYRFIKVYSVHDLLRKVATSTVPFDALSERFATNSECNISSIKLMPHAKTILAELDAQGHRHYLYTHKGDVAYTICEQHNILAYFQEIVTNAYGFKRKPDPQGINYLVNKYRLDKTNTYYVGDRNIDITCADHAGIKSILYLEKDGYVKPQGIETHLIYDLLEMKTIATLP